MKEKMKNRTFPVLMKKAQELMQREEWQSALESLRLAEIEFPDQPALLTALGDCLIHLNKPENASEYFFRVTELEPESVEAFNNLGVSRMFEQNFIMAEKAYLQALQFMPNHPQTLKNLAFLYYQQEDRLGDAATILAGLVKSQPTDVEALFLMGQCYEVGEDPESARICYERIRVFQPDWQEAKDALSRLDQKRLTTTGV
jgi:Flp pilus assembly protein TadD